VKRIQRISVDSEIAYASEKGRHKSVRLTTLERVLAISDEKTEALRLIHQLSNRLLDSEELGDDWKLIKQIREIAGKAYPLLQREDMAL
jgi:hypothetical protein